LDDIEIEDAAGNLRRAPFALHSQPLPFIQMAVPEMSSIGSGRAVRFMTVSIARELGVLLALSVMFPFMIHVIPVPGDAQLGPRLLPMFYAPLLAALWGRARSAVMLALAAPWLNWALTSHPAPHGATVMMVELLTFVLVIRLLVAAVDARWFLAAPAYLSGKIAAAALVTLFPALVGGGAALAWAAQGAIIGAPGIAILVLINSLALRYYPPGAPGGGPIAA
jgi:hypothetical protein